LPPNTLEETTRRRRSSVLILAAEWCLAYRTLRCAAACFDRVYVIGTKRARPLALSFFCRSFHQLPFEDSFGAHSIAFIRRLCEALQIDWIIPSDGPTTRFLTGAAAELGPKSYPVPDTAIFDQLNDKSTFTALCQKLGLPIPRTELLPDLHIVRARFRKGNLAFPVVLKPTNREGGDGVLVLRCEGALKWVDRLQYSPVLVQEYVEGWDVSAFFLCQEGRVKREVIYYHGRYFLAFIEDQRIADQCRKIIQATNYSGVIGFDLRQRDDGSFVFLECNPRFWYNMELTMLAGANFVEAGVEGASLDHEPFNASLGGKVVVRPMGLLRKLPVPPSRQRIRLAVLAYLAADFPLALSTSVRNVFRASRAAAYSGSRIHSRPNKARV
jgi:predicted ATP-grasp superfamily ATP-dependent carboligase